jgi:8-oxo-dGTP pyrophosphatase MutT (NUDIX family)
LVDDGDLAWRVRQSRYLVQNRWIAVRADDCELPNGRLLDAYYIVESASYVNVVPVTPNHEVVMVRMYRHGLERTILETPGGLIDAGEDALAACRRELLEETGYSGTAVYATGQGAPDPARFTAYAYYFVAEQVQQVAQPVWDAGEMLEIELVPIARLIPMLLGGEIVDSVQQSALFYALQALGYWQWNGAAHV